MSLVLLIRLNKRKSVAPCGKPMPTKSKPKSGSCADLKKSGKSQPKNANKSVQKITAPASLELILADKQKAAIPSYSPPDSRSQNHRLPCLMCWVLKNNSQFMNHEL